MNAALDRGVLDEPAFRDGNEPATAPEKFDCWGYVELMGHQRIAGRLSEQSIAGKNLLRVDIPLDDGGFRTEFYGGSAIFRITPAEEPIVRQLVKRMKPEPMFAFTLDRTPRIGTDVDDDQES